MISFRILAFFNAVLMIATIAFSSEVIAAQETKAPATKPKSKPAAKPLRVECYMLDQEQPEIEGEGIEKFVELASVSKVITSYWALQTWGAKHRFETRFHVNRVDDKTADLHIEGDNDPYFSMWQLYFGVAQLNKLGIKKIRDLTFDENFIFLSQIRSGAVSVDGSLRSPISGRWDKGVSATLVMRQLRAVVTSIVQANKAQRGPPGYGELTRRLGKMEGIQMPEKIVIEVGDIRFKANADYQSSDSTKIYSSKSLPLHELLKEMNRNSNNFAAEVLFLALGGPEVFAHFMLDTWKYTDKEIRFVNGSGNSIPLSESEKLYNKATCSPVLTLMAATQELLQNEGLSFEDVIAVAGEDSSVDGVSTTSKAYRNDVTEDSVAAKTGSVDPAVALAGLAHTAKGDVYFYFNRGTRGSSEWGRARVAIRLALVKLIQLFDGPRKKIYDAPEFSQVDQDSLFVEISGTDKKLGSQTSSLVP